MKSHERKYVRRARVMQRFLSLYEDPRYLEVGVCKAKTFDQVTASVKVAVDPVFQFDHEDPQRDRAGVSYHQVPSDEYFGSIIGTDEMFDLIYLDGLHTVEQTLRDLLNALPHLQPKGVIVIDDTHPPTYPASLPDRKDYREAKTRLGVEERAWMGDVYRLVYFIDTFCQHLSYRTVSNNHGQTVVWRERRPEVTDRGLVAVGGLSFEALEESKEVLRLAPLGDIVREVRQALGLPKPQRGKRAAPGTVG